MTRLTPTNTCWRDRYARRWAWALPVAVAAHLAALLFLPSELSDRIHEALIPGPSVLVRPGSSGPMEAMDLRAVALEEPTPPPEPEEEEEQVEPVPTETAAESITIAEVEASPSEGRGSPEGVTGGEGAELGAAGGGGSPVQPRPLHVVIPPVPDGVDKKRARGEKIHLLVHVMPDGTVSEARVEKGSRIDPLNDAALAAARKGRWSQPDRPTWVRTQIRF